MRASPKQRPTPWDGLVVVAILALALAVFFYLGRTNGDGDLSLVIAVDGQTVDTIALDTLDGETHKILQGVDYILDIRLTPTAVSVDHADCPTQDCVHTGTITKAGQSIVCLPGRVSLRLVSDAKPEIDVVIG